ncbi:MAG: nucleotidyl transferase AbiEii/AbiGii toxin family protein [Proteobacteria bacterium]|nr:nucleotidyl transferase AbiEii/AbiGii toxin family protein [Pseudomonadota bacterium]
MVEDLNAWESLFRRALVLIEDAGNLGLPVKEWTFGGGTVLMRRYRHRYSKDVDIFINDPQFIGYLTPRLSGAAASLTTHYVEDHNSVKLVFPEGEVDFVAAPPLTQTPALQELVLDHPILVETSTEIVGKKVWHRGEQFTARDIFDLALVAEREPAALDEIRPILHDRREAILGRISRDELLLRESFRHLTILDYRRSFDECVEIVRELLIGSG